MFRKRRRVAALDIGSSAIKAVELEINGGIHLLKREVLQITPGEAEPVPEGEGFEQSQAESLASLCRKMGWNGDRNLKLVSAMPCSQISIRQVKSIPLQAEEMESSLAFEARKHLPVDGEVLMDYQVLDEKGNELDILLVVTTKQAVTQHTALLRAGDLKAGCIDAPVLALANAALLNPEFGAPESFFLLNVGSSFSNACFYRKGGLFFSRDIPVAGHRFTQDLATREKSSFAQAERKKRAEGLLDRGVAAGADVEALSLELEGEGEHAHGGVDQLVREVQRSLRFYFKESGTRNIDRFFLTGGCANDITLKEHLEKELNLPLELLDPFRGMHFPGSQDVENPYQFAQAVGLALRGAHELFPDQSQ